MLWNDGDDNDPLAIEVVEHPIILNPQPKLGVAHVPQSLDSALADFCGFMAKVHLDALLDRRTPPCIQRAEVALRRIGEDDLIGHAASCPENGPEARPNLT